MYVHAYLQQDKRASSVALVKAYYIHYAPATPLLRASATAGVNHSAFAVTVIAPLCWPLHCLLWH
jgi:hypothetical protein